jgi:predicted dehydrogenase
VRVGVIGRGFGARVVAPVFAQTEGCRVVDVVSPRDGAAVAALCGRPDVDLISVHSPPFLHLAHVRLAIENGHAVLCDKPFGRNAGEAARMCDLAAGAGVVNLLNFEFRWSPVRRRIRDLMLDGTLGAIDHVQWSGFDSGWRQPQREYGWVFDAELGGGWVRAYGSHVIDFARWALGEIVETTGRIRTAIARRRDAEGRLREVTAEDGFTATLLAESGATMLIDTSYAAPADLPGRVVVIGSERVLESQSSNIHELDARITLYSEGAKPRSITVEQRGDPHRVQMEDWASVVRDAVESGAVEPGTPTFADGLACARVIDALAPSPR